MFDEHLTEKQQNVLMGFLKKYIDNLCDECISDRMANVLTPKCRRRFLINLRILAGAKLDNLPKFCYMQVKSNLERYIKKKTTLFTPIDTIIYNEDFFDLFFPKISKQIYVLLKEKKMEEVLKTINKSKIPATYIRSKKESPGLLKNIFKKDKIIREGSFIYDFNEDFFLIWFSNSLYVADLERGYCMCNAHQGKIRYQNVLELLLRVYSEGKDFKFSTEINDKGDIFIHILISGKKLKKLDESIIQQQFIEITQSISPKFQHASFHFLDNEDLEIIVEINLKSNSYEDINFLINKVDTLTESENINILDDVS